MKSGIVFLVLGIVSILIAIVGVPAFFVWQMFSMGMEEGSTFLEAEQEFLAPGEIMVDFEMPGEYMLWYHYRASFEGERYEYAAEMPDEAEVSMEEVETGVEASWQPFGEEMDFTLDYNDIARKGAGLLEIESPGTYRLEIEGEFEPRVFSIATSPFDELFEGAGTLFIVALLIGLCGVVFLILGIVTIVKSRSASR